MAEPGCRPHPHPDGRGGRRPARSTPASAMSDGEWVNSPGTTGGSGTPSASPASEWWSPVRPTKARRAEPPTTPDWEGEWVSVTPTAGSPASSGCEPAGGEWEPVSPRSFLSASSRASPRSFGDSPAGADEWIAADSPPIGGPRDDAPTRGRADTPRVVAEPATATPPPGTRSQPVEVLAELAEQWRDAEDYLGGPAPDDASPTSAADGSEYAADGARRSPAGTDGTPDTSDDGDNKSDGSYDGAYGT